MGWSRSSDFFVFWEVEGLPVEADAVDVGDVLRLPVLGDGDVCLTEERAALFLLALF